jgi:hypothetical protein
MQNGKWDRAFEISGNPDVGFDFANSPFGQDQFEGNFGISKELDFKDVFTGYIFYKPLEQHIKKNNFPFMLHNFEDSIIQRAKCVSLAHAEHWKKNIETIYKNDKIYTEAYPYAIVYNLIVNVGFSIIIGLTLVMCLIFYSRKSEQKPSLGKPI